MLFGSPELKVFPSKNDFTLFSLKFHHFATGIDKYIREKERSGDK